MVSDDRTRGQVILIGALSLAFIILGIVVVFNGVLYTETHSSLTTGQGLSDVSVTDQEIEHGLGCMMKYGGKNESSIDQNISKFNTVYQNMTVQSEPSIINISSSPSSVDAGEKTATVAIRYDSLDGTYSRNLTINATEDCPA